jgi:hemoglobin
MSLGTLLERRSAYSALPEVLIMLARNLGAIMLVAALSATTWADDRPIDRGELDRRIVTSVYQTALVGTDIFNKGKHEECFRLYQGALTSLQPLLDHRPMLMASVKDKVDRARSMKPAEAAFVLREALDEIQNEIAPPTGSDAAVAPKPVPKKASLWERLGGEKTVRAIVKDFTAAAAEDKKVNFFRDGKIKLDEKAHAQMNQLFVELISIMAGGPLEYSQKRNLKEAHAGMKITNAEFDALLAVFQKTLEKHKIGKTESDELLAHFARTRPVIVEVKEK